MSSSFRYEFAPHTHVLGQRCFKLSFLFATTLKKQNTFAFSHTNMGWEPGDHVTITQHPEITSKCIRLLASQS